MGALDLFVLHRVDEQRLVNLDGFGRGAGWAGNLTVHPRVEPWLAAALEAGLLRHRSGAPKRLFGPYWSAEAVAVATGRHLVVLAGDAVTGRSDRELLEVAEHASGTVAEVPVAKRLADELEVSQAALSIATLRSSGVEEAAEEIATRAANALSCEFGAVLLLGSPPRLLLAREGWRPPAGKEEVIAALLPLAYAMRDELLVEQDLSCSPFPYHPLAFEDGLVARAAVPLAPSWGNGILVVAHAAGTPRGFTSLCQRVLVTIGRAADVVLTAAASGSEPVPA